MDIIVKLLKECYYKYHSKKINMSHKNRMKEMNNTFNKVLDIIKNNFKKESIEYFKKRSKSDNKLEKIQNNTKKDIIRCVKNINNLKYKLENASSFSSRTYLIGESDIDIAFLVKDITLLNIVEISNALGHCGFIFKEVRSTYDDTKRYWIFNKIINDVEIELKLRDLDGFSDIMKRHTYMDNKMLLEQKIYTTYGKYLMKKYKNPNNEKIEPYTLFKIIMYEAMGYDAKSKYLIMPLID